MDLAHDFAVASCVALGKSLPFAGPECVHIYEMREIALGFLPAHTVPDASRPQSCLGLCDQMLPKTKTPGETLPPPGPIPALPPSSPWENQQTTSYVDRMRGLEMRLRKSQSRKRHQRASFIPDWPFLLQGIHRQAGNRTLGSLFSLGLDLQVRPGVVSVLGACNSWREKG